MNLAEHIVVRVGRDRYRVIHAGRRDDAGDILSGHDRIVVVRGQRCCTAYTT
jgi:hypothetical protein